MSAELQPTTNNPARADNDGGGRARAWRILWILTAAFGAILFARDLLNTGPGLSIGGEALWGRDFVNVYTSGALILQGRLDLLYDVDAYRAFQSELLGGGLRFHLFSYPPAALIYASPFALLPYPVAWISWLAGTGALFARAARPYLRGTGLPVWLALVAPASIMNLWAGHYGFLIGALWLFAWSNLARRPGFAEILIGLMIVKPHLAVLMPIVLIWRRQWIAFAAATLTVIAMVGLSAALFGPSLWVTYLTETAMLHVAMVDDVGTFFLMLMPTLMPSLAILGVPTLAATLVQATVAVGAIALLLKNMPRDEEKAGLAVATATFVVLPYAFAYDMTVVGLAGLILFRNSLERRPPLFILAAGAAAFVPMAVLYLNMLHIPVAPILIAFQLLAMLGLADRLGSRPPAAAQA